MSNTFVLELRQKRAALNKEAQGILAKVREEKRALTTEERNGIDNRFAEIDSLKVQIDGEERTAAIEAELSQPAGNPERPNAGGGEARCGVTGTKEYRESYLKMLRRGRESLENGEVRSLVESSDPDGGYLVPTTLADKIVLGLADFSTMRNLATVITTSTDKNIPVDNDDETASVKAEGASYTESNQTFNNIVLSAHKITRLSKVSEELLQDSAFDIEAHLATKIARKIGDKEEAMFVNGTGSGEATGVFVDGTLGVTTAANNALTPEEVIDLYYALKQAYRGRASWLMASSLIRTIRKMKATTGDFIWQPGLKANEPDLLMGRPVYESPYAPAFAANTKVIAFGDFSYYWIAIRKAMYLQRLNELYAESGKVGFRAYERVDGKLTLPEAVQILKIKA